MNEGDKSKDQAPEAGPDDVPEDHGDDVVETGEENSAEAADSDESTALLERIADLEDKRQRALAEAENVRRRAERQQAEAIAYANTAFARELLSISDNLDRALAACDQESSDDGLEPIIEGIEMTRRELRSVFEKHGVSRIEPLGEKFDHNLHQAMFEIEDAEAEPGEIVEVVQPGYTLRERLLRPAMVGVAKAPEGSEDNEE